MWFGQQWGSENTILAWRCLWFCVGTGRNQERIGRFLLFWSILSFSFVKRTAGLDLGSVSRNFERNPLVSGKGKGRSSRMLRWIDIPPVWFMACVILAWAQGNHLSLELSFGGVWADLIGGILVGGGILLMLLAVTEMRRQKTTVLPHQTPSRLVQSGIFSRSRNPIYLGDILVLTGLILRFDAVPALALVPAFTWVLEKRFIIPEENRMRRTFRQDWARYEQKVRRWL